jgi:hypothetical protein
MTGNGCMTDHRVEGNAAAGQRRPLGKAMKYPHGGAL